jgi:hypothetical protein
MEWKTDYTIPDEFFSVARAVYREDPHWIPESPTAIGRALSPYNRYFEKNTAWLGCEGGRARLAGFYNPDLIINDARVAFFGYWETMDDPDANLKLFSDFESWARSKGAGTVYGPINFTTHGLYRIRLNRFEDGYFTGEPYNPHYYEKMLKGLGYSIAYRYYTRMGTLDTVYPPLDPIMMPIMVKAEQAGIRFEPLTPEFWNDNIERLFRYIDMVFSGNFAYTPISYNDFKATMGTYFSRIICPRASVLALDPDGGIAGFFVNFPDYSEVCRQGAENPVPLQDLNYEKHFSLIKDPLILGKTAGVHPKWRKLGIFTVMSYLYIKWSLPWYRRVAGATVREDNYSVKLMRMVFSNPDDIEHQYGLFAKSF